MAIKKYEQRFAGNGVTGGTIANYSDLLLYTCPATVLFTRVWALVGQIVSIGGVHTHTLVIKSKKPDVNGALNFNKTLITLNGQDNTGAVMSLHSKLGPDFSNGDEYDQGVATGPVSSSIASKSMILFPNEALYQDYTCTRGYKEPSEVCAIRYLIMEVAKL